MNDPGSRGELLRRAAERASTKPFFLGSALRWFAEAEHLDDAGLARHLGCSPEQLNKLRLCRRPAGISFAVDVQRLADALRLDVVRLAELLRMAEALDSLGRAVQPDLRSSSPSAGLLAAARDREDDSGEGAEDTLAPDWPPG
jgi:hypothetical protein